MNIYVVKDYNDLLYVGQDEEEAKKLKIYVSIWRNGKQVGSIIWHPVEGWKKRVWEKGVELDDDDDEDNNPFSNSSILRY